VRGIYFIKKLQVIRELGFKTNIKLLAINLVSTATSGSQWLDKNEPIAGANQ